jgi:uncharacterized protein
MVAYTKPLPTPTPLSAPFWDGLRAREIRVQKCSNCGHLQHPPQPACVQCWQAELVWSRLPSEGTVYSYSVCHWPTIAAFRSDAPYVVAIVDLPGGVRINTNIVDCQLSDLHVGMPVEAVFDDVTDQITLLKYAPCGGPPA